MPPGTWEALRCSIQKFGLIHPIMVTPEGDVIDGILRMRVCREIGFTYETKTWEVGKDIVMARILNEAEQSKTDMTEQIEHLIAEGYDIPVTAAALGLRVAQVEQALSVPVEEPERIAPVAYIEFHPVLSHIPEIDAEKYEELKRGIRDNGCTEPILISRDGLLVDGRARWNICQELGITPVTRTIWGNGWEQSLLANSARIIADVSDMDRAIMAAKMPPRMGGTVLDDQRPPTMPFLCEVLGVPDGSVKPLRIVANVKENRDVLLEPVREGLVKPGTARRIASTVPPEHFAKAVERVIAASAAGDRHRLPEFPAEARKRAERGPITGTQDRDRNRFVTAVHVRTAIDNLTALEMVVNGTAELEPGINGDQAAELLRGLATRRRALTRLTTLLKERKEATTT